MPVHQLQDQDNDHLSHSAKQAIIRAKTSWLKNTEVMDLLVHHQEYRLPISSDPPNRPAGKLLRTVELKGSHVPVGPRNIQQRMPQRNLADNLFLAFVSYSECIQGTDPSCNERQRLQKIGQPVKT